MARGDCVEEADTKLSSDEAELCDNVRRNTARLEAVAFLIGSSGGSSFGVFMILRGSGETSSVTGRRASWVGGGVASRFSLFFVLSALEVMCGSREATCGLALFLN